MDGQEKCIPASALTDFKEYICSKEGLDACAGYFCPVLDYQTSAEAQTKSASLSDGT